MSNNYKYTFLPKLAKFLPLIERMTDIVSEIHKLQHDFDDSTRSNRANGRTAQISATNDQEALGSLALSIPKPHLIITAKNPKSFIYGLIFK